MRLALVLALLGSAARRAHAVGSMPSYVYGVNLGNWLNPEPWMMQPEWAAMGGETCDDCSACAATTAALTQKLGLSAMNAAMQTFWESWFTQDDVDQLVALKINSVRIPLGYWMIEPLVDRATEHYPQGSLLELKRGLRMLKAANISVLLDMHAMPGVSAIASQFAGLCTGDPQFYQNYNYGRALQLTASLVAMMHLDPDFETAYGLEAINEPIADASKTPGLQGYYDNFVRMVRSVELALFPDGSLECAGVPDLASALGVGSLAPSASGAPSAAVPSPTTTASRKRTSTANANDRRQLATVALPHALDVRAATPKNNKTRTTGKGTTAKKPAAPAAYGGPSLADIVAAQSDLASMVNATYLEESLALSLAMAGVDITSSPARQLFSAAALTKYADADESPAASANVTRRALPHASGMHRRSAHHRRAPGNATAVANGTVANASTRRRVGGVNPGGCVVASFHDLTWQWSKGANANSSAIGPQTYDQHPYYSFGGVADPNIGSYMQHACGDDRMGAATAAGNVPLVMGEWWIQTNFDASPDDLRRFGDAQKLMFKRPGGKGFYYWSWKITTPGMANMDYRQSVAAGTLTKDPSQLFDPNVCGS